MTTAKQPTVHAAANIKRISKNAVRRARALAPAREARTHDTWHRPIEPTGVAWPRLCFCHYLLAQALEPFGSVACTACACVI